VYALRLIYANYSWDPRVLEIVIIAVRNSGNLIVKHGRCLAIGLIALRSADERCDSFLKTIFGLCTGVMGLALIMYGREDASETLV
jgi:hypothetical protein